MNQAETFADIYADKSLRLLDIVYELHASDKGYPYQNLPFASYKDGKVILKDNLLTELQKNPDANLTA
ncbi:hypothetical protein SAMN06295945_0744 [Polynucleobacter meluiroseus]|uniref:Uncharacterized protein n=1 Tax=Polynucleobacter meluiroseus TaxID=1938814 RepID=A0A240E0G7_9BURK|nr:hypothetical protein [Polynucleobacter meluiroseus]SNX28414.1 hypothetical protein SAMN06295945_0744 [Polynucleobacter meluiroseus]